MSQRTQKVASLIQHAAAAELARQPEAARLTVTRVDVAPDMRTAIIWIGILASGPDREDQLFRAAVQARDRIQQAVAHELTTKFVPRITLKKDEGGTYADRISRLIKGL